MRILAILALFILISGCTSSVPAEDMINGYDDMVEGPSTPETTGSTRPAPPQEAVEACVGLSVGDTCQMTTPQGAMSGVCADIDGTIACLPGEASGPGVADDVSKSSKTIDTTTPSVEPMSFNVIVDTGQTDCYDNNRKIICPSKGASFYGQDAQYSVNQPSYKDNGDGTVTDLNTGLMWTQDPGEKMAYYEAVSKEVSVAGYDDWRVPSIKELYSLMDFRGTDPASMDASTSTLTPFIDTDYFNFEYGDTSTGSRIIDSQWVTTNVYVSTVMNGQECYFGVNFADGRIKCYPTADTGHNQGYFARYVRGDAYGINEFKDNGDGTVTDESTGLIWQQADSGEGMDWADALNYCEDLDLADHTDWRLPNAKELQGIVDYSRSPDTTGTPAIDPVFDTTSITNELGQKDYPFFWTATTHLRSDGVYSQGVYISFGRALGYMQEFGGWVDVHGAGAQRSDPKTGDPDDYPYGHGPQGDARRIFNYVRCVR